MQYRDSSEILVHDDLWRFALTLYTRPGVAPACLLWQARFDADVNLLLAGFWWAARHRQWSPETVATLIHTCAPWRAGAVLPLRAARRALAASAIYAPLQAAELAAERVQLQMLAAQLDREPAGPRGRQSFDNARANLEVYAQYLTPVPAPAEREQLLALCALLFSAQI